MKTIFRFISILIIISLVILVSLAKSLKTSGPSLDIQSIVISGNNIIAGGYGVFLSTNKGKQWTQLNLITDGSIGAIASSDSIIYVASMRDGIFISTDNGMNWSSKKSNLYRTDINAITVNGKCLYVGTGSTGFGYGSFFVSTDGGSNWNMVNSGLNNETVYSIAVSDTNLLVGTDNGIYRLNNIDSNWVVVKSGSLIKRLIISENGIYAISITGDVLFSNNNGINWIDIKTPQYQVTTLVASGNYIYAGTYSGIYFSTNGGHDWNPMNNILSSQIIQALAMSGNYIYAGCMAGVFYSTNKGEVWMAPDTVIGLTKVKNSKTLPRQYYLNQNYPNPFNPITNISFTLPTQIFVSLKIFDLNGKEVATIVSEELPEGDHTFRWNANVLSSEVYFYRLNLGQWSETKKMMLLK